MDCYSLIIFSLSQSTKEIKHFGDLTFSHIISISFCLGSSKDWGSAISKVWELKCIKMDLLQWRALFKASKIMGG